MSQPKHRSFTEACINTASGFIVSLIVWHFLCKLYDIPMPFERNLEITGIFTIVSVARSYLWRRAFNWYDHYKDKHDTDTRGTEGKASAAV